MRSSDPSRLVGGGGRNVSGRYPSRKMGVTIQFESHRVELAFVREMEHDPGVLEFYDQPPSFLLDYKTAKGRHIRVLHTPDFFVLRTAEAGWEECKTEEELEKLSESSPNRYCRDERETWHCPPGEAHASELGLYYRVRSSREINWVLQRNLQFLEDYLETNARQADRKGREWGLAIVSAEPGIRLSELFRRAAEGVSRDDIYALIGIRELFVDLGAAPLTEPERVRVFANREAAVAFGHVVQSNEATTDNCGGFSVRAGHTIAWDGRTWTIVNPGEKTISLLGEDESLTELPVSVFEELTKQGRIQGLSAQQKPGPRPEIDVLASAGENDLRVANGRLDAVLCQLRGEPPPCNGQVSARTLRLWVSRYRKAEACFGSGYLGLLPRSRERGNRSNRLPMAIRTLLLQCIENDYETLKQKTRLACWAALKRGCDDSGIRAPSYGTFCAAVRRRNKFTQALKRLGRRAAYQHEPPYWELERKTPRHGERPFEIAHVDHTQLDVEVICSHTGRALGRPWLTLVTDAFSRRVLAVYLTFDAPSYRSCMMALRECVRRYANLPETVVVDGGREFSSVFFEGLLARYECTKKTRPPAKARFGSLVERLFGTANTQFIHNLKGNTQITSNVRQVTQSVDPKGQAVWYLPELYEALCRYFYSIYDAADHPALGQSPREAYRLGLERTGYRLVRLIAYDQSFLMSTLPTTPKGSAKVQPGRGVKIRCVYYWCEEFRAPEIEQKRVPVRYDPFDAGTAFAFVRNRWVPCHSEYYSVLRGRSEKEIMLPTQELHKQHSSHSQIFTLNAKRLAEFLQSVEAKEALLLQRACDREAREALEGGDSRREGSGPGKDDGGEVTPRTSPSCGAREEGVHEEYGEF
ncbi:MAG: Mu transposase C-terminal domain-containing protein [Terriglobia bacterium]